MTGWNVVSETPIGAAPQPSEGVRRSVRENPPAPGETVLEIRPEGMPRPKQTRFLRGQANLDLSPTGQDLLKVLEPAADLLPPGYTVHVTPQGGRREHPSLKGSQHGPQFADAVDVQIYDPQGKPIPNEGPDTTGIYGKYNEAIEKKRKELFPDSKPITWGQAFETKPGSGKADIMHFDWRQTLGKPAPSGGEWSVVATNQPGGKVDPAAIEYQQKRPNTGVYYADPSTALGLLPPQEDVTRIRESALMRNLRGGSAIDTLPEIEVKDLGNGKLQIVDSDGRKRLQAMQEAGITAAPIAFTGLDPQKQYRELVDAHGKTVPFDFKLVPPISKKPPAEPPQSGFRRYLSESVDAMFGGGRGSAREEIPAALGDIAQAVRGVTQGVAGIPAEAREPVGPGLSRLGDVATFATGGLTSPLAPEARAVQVAAETLPVAQEVNALRPVQAVGRVPEPVPTNALLSPQFADDVAARNQARNLINQRLGESAVPGPEIERQMAAAQTAGQPVTLADIGGKPVSDLLGTLYRKGGEIGARVEKFLRDRDVAAGPRAEDAIARHMGSGTLRETQDALIAARSQAARPLWAKALNRPSGIPKKLGDLYNKAVGDESSAIAAYNKARRALAAARQGTEPASSLSPVPRRPKDLIEFLMERGGLEDSGGELRAMDLHRVNKGYFGRLSRSGGMPLDEAREIATEAGYLHPDSDINDLLNALRDNSQGRRVFSERDPGAIEWQEYETARRRGDYEDFPGLPGEEAVSPSRSPEEHFAREQMAEAQTKIERARAQKLEIQGVMERGRQDGTAGLPGALWSPRLQQFLDNPRIQQGIQRGRVIERDNAIAENRPFNPSEYAVVGTKPNGDWIVGSVPNMKLLATAKEGLDALLQGQALRNPLTGELNKAGVAVDKLRRAFLAELDRLNPDYKPAREAWSGYSSSIAALQYGRDILNRGKGHYAEDVIQHVAEMTPNEKEFAKVGLAATLRERLRNVAESGDESKALANTAGNRMRIRSLFPTEKAAEEFLDFVDRERQMFDTGTRVLRGSQTAERLAADRMPLGMEVGIEGAQGLAHLATGNLLGAARAGVRVGNKLLSRPAVENPAVNRYMADLLLDPWVSLSGGTVPRLAVPLAQNALARLAQRRMARVLQSTTGAVGGLPVRGPLP